MSFNFGPKRMLSRFIDNEFDLDFAISRIKFYRVSSLFSDFCYQYFCYVNFSLNISLANFNIPNDLKLSRVFFIPGDSNLSREFLHIRLFKFSRDFSTQSQNSKLKLSHCSGQQQRNF